MIFLQCKKRNILTPVQDTALRHMYGAGEGN